LLPLLRCALATTLHHHATLPPLRRTTTLPAAVAGCCCCWLLLLLAAAVAGCCCCWLLLLLAAAAPPPPPPAAHQTTRDHRGGRCSSDDDGRPFARTLTLCRAHKDKEVAGPSWGAGATAQSERRKLEAQASKGERKGASKSASKGASKGGAGGKAGMSKAEGKAKLGNPSTKQQHGPPLDDERLAAATSARASGSGSARDSGSGSGAFPTASGSGAFPTAQELAEPLAVFNKRVRMPKAPPEPAEPMVLLCKHRMEHEGGRWWCLQLYDSGDLPLGSVRTRWSCESAHVPCSHLRSRRADHKGSHDPLPELGKRQKGAKRRLADEEEGDQWKRAKAKSY
jgi:hypothetical protein